MIKLGDALLLASTKLRTRKVRTIVTATLASLMFVSIIFAFSLMRGVIDSYQNFTDNSLSERYIANVMFFDGMSGPSDNGSAELIAKAKTRHQQVVDQKVAEAKRLGIEYDPRDEPAVTIKDTDNGEEYLNDQNRTASLVMRENYESSQTSLTERTKKLAAPYQPIGQYVFESMGDTAGLVVMEGGRENLSGKTEDIGDGPTYVDGQGSNIESLGYLPLSVTEPYLLDGVDTSPAKLRSDDIPVIVPYSQAEAALGLNPLGKNATNDDRIDRLDEVKRRAAGAAIEVCYRNPASRQLIETARQQIRDIAKNAANENYQPPIVQYSLPDETSCGAAPIAKDGRSPAERDYQDKLYEFAVKFGDEFEPIQHKLTFRIIGISPDMPDWNEISTVESLLTMIGGSSLQGQWVVPTDLVDDGLRASLLPAGGDDSWVWSYMNHNLVEFASADDIRRFTADNACTDFDCGGSKPNINYFGSNSVLIDDITTNITNVMKWVVMVIALVAAALMAGMAGRVITDSRRETAVFRAIGAQRSDISLIYLLYMLMFSSLVAAIAIAIGLLAAWGLSVWQSENLTTLARLMFIESDYGGQYRLVGIWPLALVSVAGVVILTGIVSLLLPLMRNLVRSPLRDMRDE